MKKVYRIFKLHNSFSSCCLCHAGDCYSVRQREKSYKFPASVSGIFNGRRGIW